MNLFIAIALNMKNIAMDEERKNVKEKMRKTSVDVAFEIRGLARSMNNDANGTMKWKMT